MLGFNDTSTLVGHFVLSPREREKKDRRDSRGDEIEGQGKKRTRGPWATICSPEMNSHCISANAMQHSSSIATATRREI